MKIGQITVPTYGVIVLLGLFICNILAVSMAQKEKQRIIFLLQLEIYGGIAALLGAKLLTLFTESVIRKKGVPGFLQAGYSFYGGLAGFFLATVIILQLKRRPMKEYARYIILIPLLHAFWKMGCFEAGCCLGITKFPLQLIESAVSLGIAALLWLIWKRNKEQSLVAWYFLLYGTARFVLEFYRIHENGTVWGDGHIWSVVCVLTACGIFAKKMKQKK